MTSEEYVRHLSKHTQVVWIDGLPWQASNRRLRPAATPHMVSVTDPAKLYEIRRYLLGAACRARMIVEDRTVAQALAECNSEDA